MSITGDFKLAQVMPCIEIRRWASFSDMRLDQFQFDTDNDGYIPMQVLKTKVEAAGETSGLSANERRTLLHNADKNRDKMIDFGEFCFLVRNELQKKTRVPVNTAP